MIGIGERQLIRLQAQMGTLQPPFGPGEPELAFRLGTAQLPLPGQGSRDPAGPVAGGQADIAFQPTGAPVLGPWPGDEMRRHRAAIGQSETRCQFQGTVQLPGQAGLGIPEGHRGTLLGDQTELAVQQAGMAQARQGIEQRTRIEGLGVRRPRRQAAQLPVALGILLQDQMDAIDLHRLEPQLAMPETAEHIRHHLEMIQLYAAFAAPQAQIAQDQHRIPGGPASFESAQAHRFAQGSGGARLDFVAVFADPGHEQPPQAHIEGHQGQQ